MVNANMLLWHIHHKPTGCVPSRRNEYQDAVSKAGFLVPRAFVEALGAFCDRNRKIPADAGNVFWDGLAGRTFVERAGYPLAGVEGLWYPAAETSPISCEAGRSLSGMVLSTIPDKIQNFSPFSANSVHSV